MLRRSIGYCRLLFAPAMFCSSHLFAQQMPPAPVVASPVTGESVLATQTFVGTVMPLKVATIGSAVDGRVIERPIEEGDRVEAGQKLAQLLTDTIELELAAAQAELEYRKQLLAELENGTRPGEIAQALARREGAAALKQFLVARLQRTRNLVSAGRAATEDELDSAIASATEAEHVYLEAAEAYDLAVAGPRKERIAQARAQVAIQQAVVERLNDQIQKHTIISRFPGYVVKELTEVGQWVSRGDPVAEVMQVDEVEIVVQVVERSVPFVKLGQEVPINVPALPDEQVVGKVVAILPMGDARSRTFPVKVRVKNILSEDGPVIKVGMLARVDLPIGGKTAATMVPKDAVVLGGPAPMVIVVTGARAVGEAGTATPQPVALGTSVGDMIQVTGQIEPGQLVVVEGNERLRPGQAIKISRLKEFPAQTPAAPPSTSAALNE